MASLDLYEDIHRASPVPFRNSRQKLISEMEQKAVILEIVSKNGRKGPNDSRTQKNRRSSNERTKSAILFQGTVELGLVRDADLDSEKLRNRFIEKVCECFQTSPKESQWPDRLQIEREPYCRQFNDLAWRKNRERN